MGIDIFKLQPQTVALKPKEEKFENFTTKMKQVTTRGDGTLEKGEEFIKADIDFGASLDHLKIHHEGGVAGS